MSERTYESESTIDEGLAGKGSNFVEVPSEDFNPSRPFFTFPIRRQNLMDERLVGADWRREPYVHTDGEEMIRFVPYDEQGNEIVID